MKRQYDVIDVQEDTNYEIAWESADGLHNVVKLTWYDYNGPVPIAHMSYIPREGKGEYILSSTVIAGEPTKNYKTLKSALKFLATQGADMNEATKEQTLVATPETQEVATVEESTPVVSPESGEKAQAFYVEYPFLKKDEIVIIPAAEYWQEDFCPRAGSTAVYVTVPGEYPTIEALYEFVQQVNQQNIPEAQETASLPSDVQTEVTPPHTAVVTSTIATPALSTPCRNLYERLKVGEAVHVRTLTFGFTDRVIEEFIITREQNHYGLPAYTIWQKGIAVKRGLILSREKIDDWAMCLEEVQAPVSKVCATCHGSGGFAGGQYDAPESCPACVEQGTCPRCAHPLADDACKACHWHDEVWADSQIEQGQAGHDENVRDLADLTPIF